MSFRCDPATLERLEWSRLAECLAGLAATARGVEACRGELFSATRAAVAERLAETGEARVLLDGGEVVPFSGVADLRPHLEGASVGRTLGPRELREVADTALAAERLRRFFAERSGRAQRLAGLAATLPKLLGLAEGIGRVVGPDAQVREDASPALRKLRRRVAELQSEIDRRMAGWLRDGSLQPHLQDSYVTTREGRPVLPVRADARSRVRGIVHDVSSSGTTVFIEPEGVVEHGNRLRVAETDVEREIERLLRELTVRVVEQRRELIAAGDTLEFLDVASARARLSRKLEATAPGEHSGSGLGLRALRHPLLLLETELEADEVIPNDLILPEGARGLVISGPNAGGKTVAAKAVGLAALAVRAGLHVPCADGSTLPIFDAVHADIGDEQDLRSGLSTFSARMSNLARIVREADPHMLVIVDEIGEGTEPGEGAALAQAVLEALVDRGATVVATTHFNRLKELAGTDARFANASAEFDPETLRPTYRIHLGVPGSSGATYVAQRMGLDADVIERAHQLLDHEDRKLEALTRDLSELRQDLEAERNLATEVREQSEQSRASYEARLAQLRDAREHALEAMKGELEQAFESARSELADVMRAVQKGKAADGRAANRAYREIEALEEQAAELTPESEAEEPGPSARELIDWKDVEAGARLQLEGVSAEAVLLEPPDRRGRVVVRIGDARTELPSRRVLRVLHGAAPKPPRQPTRVEVDRETAPSNLSPECDLRGLRVDEALDRAEAHLHAVLGHGVGSVRFVHGHGTGALRSAIRAWLRDIPEVSAVAAAGDHEGGNGVTVATLSH
jgi:DNA mismatch repair protein MutS2